jgi:hypothetical protein
MSDVSPTFLNGSPSNDQTLVRPVSATLLSSNGYVDREELALIPTPLPTRSHRPIAHYDFVNAVIDTLGIRGLGVIKEQHAVSPDLMNYFGVLETEKMYSGCRYVFGMRNSNNKRFSLGITLGFRVTVCDNLMLKGDYTANTRKHTSNVNLYDILSVAIDAAHRNFPSLAEQTDLWRATQLSDQEAKVEIYDAFYGPRATGLPKHLLSSVHEHYFNPKHEEFQARSRWSMNNAFTSSINNLDGISQQKAAAAIGEYFQGRR